MKQLLSLNFAVLFLSVSCSVNSAELYPYAEVGIGYKIAEPNYVTYGGEKLDIDFGGNDTALFEVGLEAKSYSFGIKHDSQWSTGWPFNKRDEYHKTEIFVKYKIGGFR